MRTISSLRALWTDLTTPSLPSESLHSWGMIAATHAVISAGAMEILSFWIIPSVTMTLLLGLGYFLLKECAVDLRRGGSFGDSLVDLAYIQLGAFAWAIEAWNMVILLAVVIGTFLKAILAPPNDMS